MATYMAWNQVALPWRRAGDVNALPQESWIYVYIKYQLNLLEAAFTALSWFIVFRNQLFG